MRETRGKVTAARARRDPAIIPEAEPEVLSAVGRITAGRAARVLAMERSVPKATLVPIVVLPRSPIPEFLTAPLILGRFSWAAAAAAAAMMIRKILRGT